MTPPPLRQAVDAFRAGDLATMLQAAGVANVPKNKEGKVALWAELIGNARRVGNALSALNERERKALQLLQLRGGELRTERYRAILERAGVTQRPEPQPKPGGRAGALVAARSRAATYEELLAALLRSGLIWSHTLATGGATKIGWEGGRFVYIPHEVAAHLPPPPTPELQLLQIAEVLGGSARTCQRDLYLYWSVAYALPLQLTNTGLLRAPDLKRVAGQVLVSEAFGTGSRESDYRRLLFLRQLATALGLLQRDSDEGVTRVTAIPSPPLFDQAATERVRASFAHWREGSWWNELWVTYKQGSTRASGSLTDPAPARVVQARQRVLAALVETAGSRAKPARENRNGAERRAPLPLADAAQRRDGEAQATELGDAGPWIAVEDILEYLQDHDDEFLIERDTALQRQYDYYGRRAGSSAYLYNDLGWVWEGFQDEAAGWEGVEANFVRAVLTEGLYWLGLVDLGYAFAATAAGGSAPPGVSAVRLTDMGRWLLLHGPEPSVPSQAGRVVVQPNFRIFAFDPIGDNVLARLSGFAARLNAERAIEYEMTRETVYRAQLAGTSALEIQAGLEELSGAALPQNVARSLAEWQADFERIRVRPRAGWLQTADPALLDALLADPAVSPAVLKRVTPTGLLFRPEKAAEIERALLAAGELPVRAATSEEGRRASIAIDASGHVSFVHAAPSLYTYGSLHPFADESSGGWRITADSIRRAVRSGLSTEAILGELAVLALGGIPQPLERHIKAWAGHFGPATAQTLTLIQFRDDAVLQEMLADPEIAPHLVPFKPGAHLGLAVADPGSLSHLAALLAERGVELKISEP
jgi:hypothetical protein